MLDQLTEYTIPVLHPVIVHFPVALSVLAVVAALMWLLRNRSNWWWSMIMLEGAAFIGGIFSLRTGEVMEEQSEGAMMVDRFVELHETMGERAVWAMGVAVAVMILVAWWARRDVEHAGTRFLGRLLVFLLVALAAVLTALTGHIGGLMTWGVPA